jgi:hypothetical protein
MDRGLRPAIARPPALSSTSRRTLRRGSRPRPCCAAAVCCAQAPPSICPGDHGRGPARSRACSGPVWLITGPNDHELGPGPFRPPLHLKPCGANRCRAVEASGRPRPRASCGPCDSRAAVARPLTQPDRYAPGPLTGRLVSCLCYFVLHTRSQISECQVKLVRCAVGGRRLELSPAPRLVSTSCCESRLPIGPAAFTQLAALVSRRPLGWRDLFA